MLLSWEFSTTLFHHGEEPVSILFLPRISILASPLNQGNDMHVNLFGRLPYSMREHKQNRNS